MLSPKFDPNLFFQSADNVALHVPASDVFALVKRSLDLPAQWGALVRESSGDFKVIRASGQVESSDVEDILFVRLTPVDVPLDEEGIVSKDRFTCRASISVRVEVIPERSELQSFLSAIVGSHRVAQVETLQQYLAPSVRIALAQFAAEHRAADLVEDRAVEQAQEVVRKGLEGPLFRAGMTLCARPTVTFTSQAARQVLDAQEDAALRHAEHQATRQVQEALESAQGGHLEHLSSLLSRLKEMAATSPDVELSELVKTFSERERGEIYQALFAGETPVGKTRWIVVAAGDELLFYDPEIMQEPSRRLKIVGDVGPVRSIQTARVGDGDVVLLLGASSGVYRLPLDRVEPDRVYTVADAREVQGGFNSAAIAGDRVWASHSELGLHEWASDGAEPSTPRFAEFTKSAKTVRGVQCFDGNLYCAMDNHVVRWLGDDDGDPPEHVVYRGSYSAITCLCPTSVGLFAGNVDGDVLHWSGDRMHDPKRLHTGTSRAAESIWLLDAQGVKRLVYTDTSLHVHARVLGDSYSCRYEAGGQTLRRVEVGDDLIVATNELRDRLICWSPGEPSGPKATVTVSRLCGRTIQDVCLVAQA